MSKALTSDYLEDNDLVVRCTVCGSLHIVEVKDNTSSQMHDLCQGCGSVNMVELINAETAFRDQNVRRGERKDNSGDIVWPPTD